MLTYLLKKFYIVCAVLIITLAVLVQGGRSLFPLLEHYDQEVAGWLSQQLDIDLRVGTLETQWRGLRPEVTFHQLVVHDSDGRRLLGSERVFLRLNLFSSILQRRLAWDKIELRRPHLNLSQGEDGFWGLPSLPAADDKPFAPDDLLTLFQLGTRVELLEARIDLSFANGHQQRFVAPYLLLEHQERFHRISLQIDFEGRDRALVAILEGYGDPRDPERFQTQGYLQLRDFPILEPLTALGGILLGKSAEQDWYREGHMDASLWFSSAENGKGYDWSGSLSLDEVALPIESLTLNQVSANLQGQWRRNGAWKLAFGELSADWRDRALEPLQVSVSTEQRAAPVTVKVEHLELDYWVELAEQLGLLNPPFLKEVATTLTPRGSLRHLHLQLPQDDWRGWNLKAELEDVAVEPWLGVPGLTGVTGYLEASQTGGFVDLNSHNGFSMYFDKIYAEPMHYQSARGQVAWHLRPEDNQIYVNSGQLELQGPGEQAWGSMWLALPWERNTGDIDLYLDIYGQQLNANVYGKYLPKLVPGALRGWLDRSIGTANPGRAARAHFLFRGTINASEQPLARSYQLALDMEGADLAYHADWPALSDLSGQLVLNDNRAEAQVAQARVYQSHINEARIVVEDNPAGEGQLLSVEGQVDALASDGLQLLREGYLRRFVGGNMDSWSAQGALVADLDLVVPLREGQPGAHQRIDMTLNLPRLTMGDLRLTLRDVRGPLQYSDASGLRSDGITGAVFGAPLALEIGSEAKGGVPATELTFSGQASGAQLAEWSQYPELRLLEGDFDFDSTLVLYHHPNPDLSEDQQLASLTLRTDLEAVALDLPAPLGKAAGDSRPVALNVILGRYSSLADLRYGDGLHAVAQLNENREVRRAALGFNVAAALPDAPGVRLDGHLETLDLQGWQAAFERHSELLSPSAEAETRGETEERPTSERSAAVRESPASALTRLPIRANIDLDYYRLGALTLEDLQLELASRRSGWQLAFTSPRVAGDLEWAEGSNPALHLARLDLSRQALTSQQTLGAQQNNPDSAVAGENQGEPFDLSTLPPADVTVDRLTVDGEDYGQWAFQWRPGPDQITLDNLTGQLRGLSIEGVEEGQGGRLVWSLPNDTDGTAERTLLQALLRASDLSEVTQQWGQGDIIESSAATYWLSVSWDGPPQSVQLEKLSGDVGFDVRAGRFKRNPAAGSDGILRLFAILNFDSLARRLRLDFSDLYQSGLAFDSIEGRMTFERGSMLFSEPILVRTPSSRLQLGGSVNLIDETLDARLVATLPVAGNLTFLTALAAGLPAAAGVFLVSKLFEKQVDQATSISYIIRGDWDNPVIKFDRLFEGGASLNLPAEPLHSDSPSSE